MLAIIEDQSDISQVSVSSLLYCVSRLLAARVRPGFAQSCADTGTGKT